MSSTDRSLADLSLSLPDGTPTRLSDHGGDPLVVVLVRYFGCLPCQEFLVELDRAKGSLPKGTNVVAVGGSADFQAVWLRDKKRVSMPLLLDPEQRVRAAVDLGDLTAAQMARPSGGRNYVRSLTRGFRPQRPTKDALRAPGVAVFGPDFDLRWIHRGEFLGDYPTVAEIGQVVRGDASSA